MEVKLFEVRDRATCFPVMCTRMRTNNLIEQRYLDMSGYGTDSHCVMMIRMNSGGAHYDPYSWGDRTHKAAHVAIERYWDKLKTGDVIDVRYLLKEEPSPALGELWQLDEPTKYEPL